MAPKMSMNENNEDGDNEDIRKNESNAVYELPMSRLLGNNKKEEGSPKVLADVSSCVFSLFSY
jgi:hypothetical protein